MSGWETDKGAPLLSVIVPVYQAARYLRACVESILAQDFDDFELLLVDDGSTDGSGALCDEFGKRDRRVRVVHQENRGVTRTRERAAELARGTLLLWVDADDTIEAGLFAGIAAVHGRTDADIILYGWRETRGAQPFGRPSGRIALSRRGRREPSWRHRSTSGATPAGGRSGRGSGPRMKSSGLPPTGT